VIREWPKQHSIHDAEHRRVGADAQRQRKYADHGESGRLQEQTRTVPDVISRLLFAAKKYLPYSFHH